MFQKPCREKRRWDPGLSGERDLFERNGQGRFDRKHIRCVFVIASSDESDRATVLDSIRVGVNPFVPARRNTKHQNPAKCDQCQYCNETISVIPRIHCRVDSGTILRNLQAVAEWLQFASSTYSSEHFQG